MILQCFSALFPGSNYLINGAHAFVVEARGQVRITEQIRNFIYTKLYNGYSKRSKQTVRYMYNSAISEYILENLNCLKHSRCNKENVFGMVEV